MDLELFFPRRRQNYWEPFAWPQSDPLEEVLLPTLALADGLQRQLERRDASQLANDPNKFQVKIDCSHFKPEEIEVKTVDNDIVIHGKHEEKMDKHGWVQREFTRRYTLPKECEAKEVKSALASNGVLTIEAPKKRLEPIKGNERVVPIKVTHELSGGDTQKQIKN